MYIPTDINYTCGEGIKNITGRQYDVVVHICYSAYTISYSICDLMFEKEPKIDTFI